MKLKKLINDYLDYASMKGHSPRTLRTYRFHLLSFCRFIGDIRPEKIKVNNCIDSYQKSLITRHLSSTSQAVHLTSLRTFFKYLKTKKDIKCLDPEKIELPKVVRKIGEILTEEELARLLKAAAGKGRFKTRARAILEVLICSGIRNSELCNLKISDINWQEKTFVVTGKGNKERKCFLTDSAIHFLKRYLETRRHNSEYLFTSWARRKNTKGKPIMPRSVQSIVKQFAKKAGIKKRCYPHMLRRSFGSSLLKKGVDLRYIKDFLGHENIQTTTFYTKPGDNELERIYRVVNNRNRIVEDVPEHMRMKQEFVMSKESFYKLTGSIAKNREILYKICKKLKISP